MHTASFDPIPESARAARDFVRGCLAERDDVDDDIAILLVSELASNAIRHTGLPFEVWVDLSARCVRVGVDDPSPVMPVLGRAAADDDTGGRGLAMVETAAARWGIERTDHGKRAWFELCP